jgi:hypothetical protein
MAPRLGYLAAALLGRPGPVRRRIHVVGRRNEHVVVMKMMILVFLLAPLGLYRLLS